MALYVVWFSEQMRDGREESARIFASLDNALAAIDRTANGFSGTCMSFRLFELGKEIPIVSQTIEEPQPAKTRVKYGIRKE